MTARVTAVLASILTLALVVAQVILPRLDLFHTWQYALALAILGIALAGYVLGAVRGDDGALGHRIAVAVCGALLIALAGLVSGLMGPDTTVVVKAPGTVAPLPDIGGAAFFTNAGAETIARGDATIVFRRMRHRDVIVSSGPPRFLAASSALLETAPAPAAYVEAGDAAGNRLTITQPGGVAFLSPVLQFRESQQIAGQQHPVDALALPAAHRSVRCVYFFPSQTTQLHLPPDARGKPAILFEVEDERGKPLGIGIGRTGQLVELGGLHLRATLGTYPQLIVAAAPHPYALILGGLLFFGGLAAAAQKAVTLEKVKRLNRAAGTTMS